LAGPAVYGRHDKEAAMEMWAFVIIGGPLLLALAFVFGRTRSRKADRQADPVPPSDDPAKGMH
jgi:hypothetical protein